jgi:hypothetical protein
MNTRNFLTKVGTLGTAMAVNMQFAAGSVLAQSTTTVGNAEITDVTPGKGFALDVGNLINSVLSFVMVIAALLVFLYLIWGGIEWITSGGDKSKTESARNKITAAVIGLVILAASYAILLLILNFLGFSGLSGNDGVFGNIKTINSTE